MLARHWLTCQLTLANMWLTSANIGSGVASGDAAAASAVCIHYVIIGGHFAPPYKYIVEYIQQKKQQHLQKQLRCQCELMLASMLANVSWHVSQCLANMIKC